MLETARAERVDPLRSTPCSYCGARDGAACVPPTGKLARSPHRIRLDDTRSRWRSSLLRCRIREDDARLGLAAGEVYICQRYPLDPSKVTALYREPDGHEPEVILYHRDYDFLGFVADSTGAVDPLPFVDEHGNRRGSVPPIGLVRYEPRPVESPH